MRKKVLRLLLITTLFSIISCNTNGSNSNSEPSFSYDLSFINPNENISSIESVLSSEEDSSYYEEETQSIEEVSSFSIASEEKESSNNFLSSESSSSIYVSSLASSSSKDYELLTTPNNKSNPIDITNWQNFSFVDELPDGFTYIYGNNKATPDIYKDGGGLVMDKNEGPRKGVQTPYFNTWNKIELRIQLGKFHGTSKSQNKNDPVFTIDCYSESGSLIDTYFIEDIDVSENSEVKTYIRNSSVSYLEIRATNLPSKSNKVYNFGIAGISLKGWIYD